MSLKSSVKTRFLVKMTYFDHGCRPWLLTKNGQNRKKKLKKYQIRIHFHLTNSGSSHEPKKLGPNSFYGQLPIWSRFDTSSILVFTVLSILPNRHVFYRKQRENGLSAFIENDDQRNIRHNLSLYL